MVRRYVGVQRLSKTEVDSITEYECVTTSMDTIEYNTNYVGKRTCRASDELCQCGELAEVDRPCTPIELDKFMLEVDKLEEVDRKNKKW